MFKENNQHTQDNFFNSSYWMDSSIENKLSKTWAPIFYEYVFCKIDEKPFAVLYSENGRGNFPVNILLSLEYIKHMFGYSDDELIKNYYFNYLINYAIGIRTLGGKNLAERTIYEFRERVYSYAIKHPNDKLPLSAFEYDEITKEIISCPNKQIPVSSFAKNNDVVAHSSKDVCNKCPSGINAMYRSRRKTMWCVLPAVQRILIKASIKENTSKRAGIEGINSALKRKYGLGKLKVRGQNKCNIVTGIIITAHNFVKFAKLMLKYSIKIITAFEHGTSALISQ